MKHLLFLLSFLCICVNSVHAGEIDYVRENELLLRQLDDVIAHKNEYQQTRLHLADSIRQRARTMTGYDRIRALQGAYKHYNRFLSDSVFTVLGEIKRCPEYASDRNLQLWVDICAARNYGVMGLYSASFDLLDPVDAESLDHDLQLHYFNTIHAVTGWMADFSAKSAKKLSSTLRERSAVYFDRIYELEKDPFSRTLIRANMMLDSGKYQQCIDTLLEAEATCDPGAVVYLYAIISEAYDLSNQKDEAIFYLVKTSIHDLQEGVTEYMALPILSERMKEKEQGERAYRYFVCSLEDANISHSSLRALEASTIFPIIDSARCAEEKRHRMGRQTNFAMGMIVIILLIGLIIIFFREHGKSVEAEVRQKKRHLAEMSYIAEHDELTGLLNRFGGKHHIIQALEHHQAGYFGVLDVDSFKKVNDTYGHDVGDKVLQQVAKCFEAMPQQVVSRLGGDEFWSYCSSDISSDEYRERTEQFFAAIRTIRVPEMGNESITVSFGVVFYDGKSDIKFEDLYREADRRLYVSKQTHGCALTL